MDKKDPTNVTDNTSRWLKCRDPGSDRQIRLFCFHHAGGTASAYLKWPDLLRQGVHSIAVQLPGRADRFAEPPYDRMGPLVGRLKDELASMLCDQPYAFFGYSMGARVAFALSRAVRDAGLPGPQMLFVAASPGPSLAIPVPGWQEPDTGLVEYLEDVGGTPSEVLAKQELMELLLPTIRADLTAVATWPYSVQDPLSCPIRAIAGERDDYASPDRMSAWKAETAADFKMSVLQGDHFFLHTDLARIVEIVNNDLAAVLESTDSRLKRTLDQPNGFSHNIR